MRITRNEQYSAAETMFKTLDAMDSKDKQEDNRISASVWNKFVENVVGNNAKTIKYSIDKENALKSIRTYLAIQNADNEMLTKWNTGIAGLFVEKSEEILQPEKEKNTYTVQNLNTVPFKGTNQESETKEIPSPDEQYKVEFPKFTPDEKIDENLPPIPFKNDYKAEEKNAQKPETEQPVEQPKPVKPKRKPLTEAQKQARADGDNAAWVLFPYANIIEPEEYASLEETLVEKVNSKNVMDFLKGYKIFKNAHKHLKLENFFEELHYKYSNCPDQNCNLQDAIQTVANQVLYNIEKRKGNKNDIQAIRTMLENGNITEDDAKTLDKITAKYIR